MTYVKIISIFAYKLKTMKRYQILKNGELLVEVDSMVEMYNTLGIKRQHYHQSLKGLMNFNYKKDNYQIIDKLIQQ